MSTIKRFEDLEVWKESRLLCLKVREIFSNPESSKEFTLRNQILGSSGSVMDNIAEGFERDGKKEFLQFLYIAKGSLGETRSQIHRSFDSGIIKEIQYNELLSDCLNLSGKLSHFIKYLKESEFQGVKRK